MATAGGRLILLLASRDLQTAKQLADASTLSLAETTRQLERLTTRGFIIASGASGEPLVYQLNPKEPSAESLEPQQRVLALDDDSDLLEFVMTVLEDEGYAVLAAATPTDGVALLQHTTFDVVITDGFSSVPSAVLTNAADVLRAAGATPVALFSAHPVELAEAQAAGFRTVIQKPCDLDELLTVIKDCGLPLVSPEDR
jgi:CheY-like chemotaxis protein